VIECVQSVGPGGAPATAAPDVVCRHQWQAMLSDVVRIQGRSAPLRVLVAGAGWALDVDDVELTVSGVREAQHDPAVLHNIDLTEPTVIDLTDRDHDTDPAELHLLADAPLPEHAFDVVYSGAVLEHVHDAERLLDRLVRATRPGGILLLLIPERESVAGLLARRAPHRLHTMLRRYVPSSGVADPCPAVFDPVLSRRGMRRFAASRGLSVEAEWAERATPARFGALGTAVDLGLHGVAMLSLGRLTATYDQLVYVLRTPAQGG